MFSQGCDYLSSAKEAYQQGDLLRAKKNASEAATIFYSNIDTPFEYLDSITLIQSIASQTGNLNDYESVENSLKDALIQCFFDKAPLYYALHQFDKSELYASSGYLVESEIIMQEAFTALSDTYGSEDILLYLYYNYRAKLRYRSEDYYECIDLCQQVNELWITLERSTQYYDSFLTMLYSGYSQINRIGIINIILLSSAYGKINNSRTGIQLLETIRNLEGLDYYTAASIELGLAELYAREHDLDAAARLMQPYENASYDNYPDLAACIDTIRFLIDYSSGNQYHMSSEYLRIAKLSDTISNDYLNIHRFNFAVALASQRKYQESLLLSLSIGKKGLSLQMALYHELMCYEQIKANFSIVCNYYLNEIQNIFYHYNEDVVFHHLEDLEYHISLCLGSMFSDEIRNSKYAIPGEQLYEFFMNIKGITLEGSYYKRQCTNTKIFKKRDVYKVIDIQEKLDPDTVLLEYSVIRTLEKSYYGLFIISSNDVSYRQLGSEDELNDLLHQYREHLSNPIGYFASQNIDILKMKLRRVFLLSIKNHLINIKKIIIAPVGELQNIPFELLLLNNMQELVSSYDINYLNIGRELIIPYTSQKQNVTLLNSIHTHGEPTLFRPKEVLVIGNPKLHNLPALPYADLEARIVGNLLHVPFFIRAAATHDLFLSKELNPRLIHLATHGFFHENNESDVTGKNSTISQGNIMMNSGIYLAEDYPLNADEISSLPLSDAKLCVLSACCSGIGPTMGNEGAFGLRRAFFLAGCKCILVTLWNIQDFTGLLLIKLFYKGLIKKHLNTQDALSYAKYAMRTRTIRDWLPEFKELSDLTTLPAAKDAILSYLLQNETYIPFEHPYYWAGYILIGEPVYLI